MKKENKNKKYDILTSMNINNIKIYAIITIILLSQNLAFCDTIATPYTEYNGKIKTAGGGLIIMRDKGIDLTYHREVNSEYFGDTVMYKKNIFSKQIHTLNGRIESLDRMNAIIYTPVGKIEIQRYKIKDIIMKVPNRGY